MFAYGHTRFDGFTCPYGCCTNANSASGRAKCKTFREDFDRGRRKRARQDAKKQTEVVMAESKD